MTGASRSDREGPRSRPELVLRPAQRLRITLRHGRTDRMDGDTVRLWDLIGGAAGWSSSSCSCWPSHAADAVRGHVAEVLGRIATDPVDRLRPLAGVGLGRWQVEPTAGSGGMFAGLFVVGGAIFAAIILVSEGFAPGPLEGSDRGRRRALPALVRLDDWAGLSGLPAAVAMFLGALPRSGRAGVPHVARSASGAVAVVLLQRRPHLRRRGCGSPRLRRHRGLSDDQRTGCSRPAFLLLLRPATARTIPPERAQRRLWA